MRGEGEGWRRVENKKVDITYIDVEDESNVPEC